MDTKQPRVLSPEETRELHIAQRYLELGAWSFDRYSLHLSQFVYAV